MHPDPLDNVPEFPSLGAEVTLLSMEGRATGALQSLVLDHLLLGEGGAYWIDARNNATTQPLAKVAPSRRILEQVQVARAFTPFQHYSIIEDLPAMMTSEASLLVLPDVEFFYDADELQAGEGTEMLRHALSRIASVADEHDLPVLLTRHSAQGLGAMIPEYVDSTLECTMTQFGPRFSGDDFETLLFECNGSVQTTLAFWRRILKRRHSLPLEQSHSEVSVHGTH